MTSRLTMQYRDYSDEVSTLGYRGVTMTAANFDAQVALQDTLISNTDLITLGILAKYTRVAADVAGGAGLPVSEYAQREMKWLISYEDDVTTQRYTIEVPTPDLTLLFGNTDLMDITAGTGLAFKNALEAYQLSPDGNAVTMLKAQLVGRNL